MQDDWSSIAATIEYGVELGSTFAQFKVLTPYPGTPLWTQLESRVYENDWQKFDGFTPTFTHPNLNGDEVAAATCLGARSQSSNARPQTYASIDRSLDGSFTAQHFLGAAFLVTVAQTCT